MPNLQRQIQDIALNEKEAAIYVAALELGSGTLSDLSRRSGVKRGAAYYTAETLARKDLLIKAPHGKRLYYRPANPQALRSILDKKRKQTEDILPSLQEMFKKSTRRPSTRVYEHREGLRNIYNEIAAKGRPVYSIFSAEKYFRVFSEKDGEKFLTTIMESGGSIKDLVENTPEGKQYIKSGFTKGFGASKLLPEGFTPSTDLLVSGDTVAMVSLTSLMGVVIDNLEIADLQRDMFMYLWEKAK